jgi:membrane fusion protein, heavy metal efflux system
MKLHLLWQSARRKARPGAQVTGDRMHVLLALALAVAGMAGCNEPAGQGGERSAATGRSTADSAATKTAAVPARSDLDQPVEDLLAASCEHGVKTYECPECRYETGFVLAPAALFTGGLMQTNTVSRERIQIPLQLTGEVRFDERRVTHVTSPVEGIVRQAAVALGERVKAGQPLVEIESVAVGEAEGVYLEAVAVQRLATRNFERLAALRDKAIASEKDYLQSQQELEAAQIRTEAALGRLTRLGMSPEDVAALRPAAALGRMVLRAPASGTVLTLHAVPGEMTTSDEALATIGNNATVWVWADLYEGDIERIAQELRRGALAARIRVKAYPEVWFPGTVDFMSPLMEESSRTVKLRVEVQNSDGRLLAGMFATVEVFLPGNEAALVVPQAAILADEGRTFLFIHHHGDYYVRRPVTIGREWGDRAEVLRGLSGSEVVVGNGSFLMKSDVLRSKMGAGCAD